jgi:hypothetical protein
MSLEHNGLILIFLIKIVVTITFFLFFLKNLGTFFCQHFILTNVDKKSS